MPATLVTIIDAYAYAPSRRNAYLFAGGGLILGAAVWMFVGTVQASSTTTVAPLYPTSAPAIQLIDVPNMTVLQVVRKLPITSRFDTLLSNAGVKNDLQGTGPYTIFAPANNYFDYLPKGAYASLTRSQEHELAAHLVVSNAAIDTTDTNGPYLTLAQDTLPVELQDGTVTVGDGYAIRGYRASNGIVYVINRVLAPEDLQPALSGE
jgi:uncharacterized surface protein with fasciclin (FAS1) repeats